MSERRGAYTGKLSHLKGEVALIVWKHPYSKRMRKGKVYAQFNNALLQRDPKAQVKIGHTLGYGWHEFPEADFKLFPKVDWSKPDPSDTTYSGRKAGFANVDFAEAEAKFLARRAEMTREEWEREYLQVWTKEEDSDG